MTHDPGADVVVGRARGFLFDRQLILNILAQGLAAGLHRTSRAGGVFRRANHSAQFHQGLIEIPGVSVRQKVLRKRPQLALGDTLADIAQRTSHAPAR